MCLGGISTCLVYEKSLVLSPALGWGGGGGEHNVLTTWFLICVSKMTLKDDGNAGTA